MSATGVPSFLEGLLVARRTEVAVRDLQDQILEKMPKTIINEMLSKFQVNGAIPVTSADFDNLESRLESRIKKIFNESNNIGGVSLEQKDNQENQNVNNSDNNYQLWTWNGKIHFVPQNFVFPSKCNVKSVYMLWFYGNKSERMAPLYKLSSCDLTEKSSKGHLSKTMTIMNMIREEACILNYISKESDYEMSILPIIERENIFLKLYSSFCRRVFQTSDPEEFDNNRAGDVTIITIYNRLSRNNDCKRSYKKKKLNS